MTQRSLFKQPPADGDLTPRQQAVLHAMHNHGPLDEVEAGKIAHATSGRHGHEGACSYCADSGLEVLKALRKRGLVKHPRGQDYWVLVGGHGRTAQGELPEDF